MNGYQYNTFGSGIMDEKKREKLLKICRIVAIILALIMIVGVIIEPFFR